MMENADVRLEKLVAEHQTMKALLQCPVCLDMLVNPARTKCGHVFCTACIEDYVAKRGKRGRVACPSCKVMGVTKRSLEADRSMAELVVEVRRLLQAEKEDTNGHLDFLEIRIVNKGARESGGETPGRSVGGKVIKEKEKPELEDKDMLDMIGDCEESEGSIDKNTVVSDSAEDAATVSSIGEMTELPGVKNPGKRRLARKKKEPLVVSTIKQAWNKQKVMQRKTYSKAPSTPSTANLSLQASQVLPGEELSGDEEYFEERRKRNLPKVATEVDKVGRWLGDSSTGEYVDLSSQPNPSQSSVSTPANKSSLPPRELPDISPLDTGITRTEPLPLSPLDTNTMEQASNKVSGGGVVKSKRKIQKQNHLWDKMIGKKTLTPSPMNSDTSVLSPSPTMSQVMPNSCQVEVNDTFDNLIESKKAPTAPGSLFCSQMSSLDDSLPALLSPGVSLNIINSLESDSGGSGEEVGSELNIEKNQFAKAGLEKNEKVPTISGDVTKSVSLSDLLAAEERAEKKGKGKKKVSWGDSEEKTDRRSLANNKKSPGWSKIGLVIGEMEAITSVPQGKYPTLSLSNTADKDQIEEGMEIEPVDSIELEEPNKEVEQVVSAAPAETDAADSFPSVISASVSSVEEKSYKVVSALCGTSSPGTHGGWASQEAGESREKMEKVGRLVEMEEERLASHEAEIARLGSESSGRRASFNLDISTCELERVSVPQDTADMVASIGEEGQERCSPLQQQIQAANDVNNIKCSEPVISTVKTNTKQSTSKAMKVSFSLVGRVRSSIPKPSRDKVVSFLQLGRLATPTITTSSLPSLRDILAKTSSATSELGDPGTTPQPRKAVAQWLRNIHTPDSMDSGATPARGLETTTDMGIQTSQSLAPEIDRNNVDEKQEYEATRVLEDEMDVADNFEDTVSMSKDVIQEEEHNTNSNESTVESDSNDTEAEHVIKVAATENPSCSPPPTLSTLLQTHLATISPPPPLSSRRNARLGRKKGKTEQSDPFQDPVPGTSGVQKRSTRSKSRIAGKENKEEGEVPINQSTDNVPVSASFYEDVDNMHENVDIGENNSQVASSCPDSQTGDKWVINMTEESNELPDIDRDDGDKTRQPFMASILGTESGLYSQDKETEEEELERVARMQFEEENVRNEGSPGKKRGRMDVEDTDDDSPAKQPRKKKVRRIESDDDSSQDVERSLERKSNSSNRSSIKKTARGTAFENTFQGERIGFVSSQVIEVIDSQENRNTANDDDWTEEDMELPLVCPPASQGTQSKSLLDSPSTIPANISRSSSCSISSLTSDSEPDQRTTQEIKRDLALAEKRASKLRSDMHLNVEVLGSQAFFQDITTNIQAVDTLPSLQDTESMGLNDARQIEDTEPMECAVEKGDINETTTCVPDTEAILGSEDVETEALVRDTKVVDSSNLPQEIIDKDKSNIPMGIKGKSNSTVPDSDDDLFSQTPENQHSKSLGGKEVLSSVLESIEEETSQIIKPTCKVVSVDTSNWKFVTSNLISAVRKVVPQFIASLQCKGLVGKVDDTVTHIIVSTGEELEAQRTLKYLQGVASGVMIVSHLWVEACMVDRSNLGKAENWEVTDEELMGANGPWRARKRREEGREPLLSGFQFLVDGELDGLDKSSVEDLLTRAGARSVPDKNAFSYTSEVTRLVLVDSTAAIGAKLVGKLLKTYRLAMVDKDWLLDTIGGHCVRSILGYTLATVQKEDLERVGYSGALVEETR